VRLADLIRRLSGTANGAKVVALDVARALPFPLEGQRIAPGLAALDAQPGLLVATSSEPGTIAGDSPGHYGPYAMAIAEMVRDPTRQFDAIFKMIRKRTFRATEGRQITWHVSALTDENDLASVGVPRPPNIQDVASPPQPAAGELSADAALALAIEADSLSHYVHYVETYPSGPYAARIRAAVQTRREALTWLRATELKTAEGYWTYLLRYADGAHAGGAARRLQRISAKTRPQPDFAPVDFFDVPPPLAGESLEFTIPPAQPVPDALVGPPPSLFVDLPPPSPPVQLGRLPSPGPLPLILSVRKRPPLRSISRILPYEGAIAAAPAPMVSARDRLSRQITGSTSLPPVGRAAPSQTATLNQEPPAPPPPPVSMQPQQSPSPVAAGQANPPPTVPIPRVRPRDLSVAIAAIASPRRSLPAPRVPAATAPARLLPLWPFGSTVKKSTPMAAARIRP